MTTTEQKIEKLLEDLDSYASYNSYDRGLPLGSESCKNRMKAIVQDFVDSLKDGDNTEDFDENQLNAYRAFLEAGIPDEWAKAMADRVIGNEWELGLVDEGSPGYSNFLWFFTRWDSTEEGAGFWYSVAHAVKAGGFTAFSKFQCPK